MDDPGSWLLACVCLIGAVFFAMTVLSLRRASWVRIEETFESRGRSYRARRLREHSDRLISACAVLRLLANLGVVVCVLKIFLWPRLVEMAAEGGVGGGTGHPLVMALLKGYVVSALLLSIFVIAIPHAWANYGSTTFLVRCYPVLKVVNGISVPFAFFPRLFDPIIRRMAGIREGDRLEERQEELLNVVEEGRKDGIVDEEEHEMIESVLEFRETTVGEIMTPRTDVAGIVIETPLAEVIEFVIKEGHSRYPVYEESIDKTVGMLYVKDLLTDLNNGHDQAPKALRDRLRKPFFVPESKKLRDLLHDFQNHKIHIAVVLDEYGGTAGIVTIEDILEELVGEITDEYEVPQPEPLTAIDETTFEVDARVHVDELNDRFDLSIPEDDDYETVGGFVFAQLGYIPATGEVFQYGSLRFTILDAEERKINRIRLERLPVEASSLSSEESAS